MSGELSRRSVLLGSAAFVAAASLPAIVPIVEASTPAEVIPAWVVGSEGEFDWQHIVAKTQREALRIFAADNSGNYEEECTHEDYHEGCDCCEAIGSYEAQRVTKWDGLAYTTPGDWLRANLGHICSRCSYETCRENDGHAIGQEAVCSDCMTLADWDIVDPEQSCGNANRDQHQHPDATRTRAVTAAPIANTAAPIALRCSVAILCSMDRRSGTQTSHLSLGNPSRPDVGCSTCTQVGRQRKRLVTADVPRRV